ncbi:unnamed protein product [Protopolystoma xenopodis]|uniref:Secreted protein n=1 Tax=Protopolystoma xenopodis TaxID=117903 RepID=A0A3S5ASJ6_9PLAT|nr:unnamed protein product [Protopolystoma xenopodis]
MLRALPAELLLTLFPGRAQSQANIGLVQNRLHEIASGCMACALPTKTSSILAQVLPPNYTNLLAFKTLMLQLPTLLRLASRYLSTISGLFR